MDKTQELIRAARKAWKLRENKTREELISEAQAIDRAKDRSRKTPTKKLKNDVEYEKMLNYQPKVEEPVKEVIKSESEWDVKIGDPIEYFDPELSYELTGYRPITKDKGLDFDPKVFTVAADTYRKEGRYTNYTLGTFKHREHWQEEFRRCRDGYTVGKYTLTGKNYFWLNYYRLLSVLSDDLGDKRRKEDFPRFFVKQYEFFHYKELCKKLGKDINSFKSRGVGFSEMSASDVACDYTVFPNSYSIITAYTEGYVTLTLSKVWQELEFLNTCTEGAFKHVRMKIDTSFKKKASKVDKDRNESGWGSIIEGIVHDNPRKLRGARVDNLIFEECLDPDTLVIMPDYSRKRIEDIKVGDFVMGINGTPQEVIATHSGVDDMFEIQLKKGQSYKVNSKHLLYVEHRPRVGKLPDEIKLLTCQDYFNLSDYNKRTTYGLKSSGLEFGNTCELDPYFFGLWLGDGFGSGITIIINETDDPEIAAWVNDYFKSNLDDKHHLSVRESTTYKRGATQKQLMIHSFSGNKGGPNLNKLLRVYHKYNLINNKHIPVEIFYTPIDYRLKVLAGIIDTDGNLKKGSRSYSFSYEVAMSRKELIDQIAELARSCGFYCYVSSRVMPQGYKNGSISHRVTIHGDFRRIPVQVKRKLLPTDYKLTTNALSTSFNVNALGRGKYVGITLKSYNKPTDNLFLLDDYTIVHNCGSDKVLLDTYILSQPLVDILGYRIGTRVTGGTGGDESSALSGLKSIFYNPKSYTVLPYKNRYGRNGEVQYTGFFIPSYTLWFGKYDSRGVCDEEAAKAFYNEMFEATEDPKAKIRKKAEYCFTPEDAFVLEGSGVFDTNRLSELKINIDQRFIEAPKKARLIWPYSKELGGVNRSAIPTIEFIDSGLIKIAELPIKDDTGKIPDNLYCIGIDAIDAGGAVSTGLTDLSKYAIVVFRRLFGLKPPKIVAVYKERPEAPEEAHDTALKLAQFYNAKVLFEATRVSIFNHFKRYNQLGYFLKRPKATLTTARQNVNLYGCPASPGIILHQIELILLYIIDYYDLIDFIELVEELLTYSYENKTKFDLTVAFGMALLADEDLLGKSPKIDSTPVLVQNVGYYKNKYGQKVYGVIPTKQEITIKYEGWFREKS